MNIMVIGYQINIMVKEYSLGLMATNIMENGQIIKKMEKENSHLSMVISIMDHGLMINFMDNDYFVRAGYSANASIVTEKRDSVLAISEALLQYDLKTKEPYIEVEIGEQEFEKREIELGLSDGINAEIISGVTKEDKIKIWNETEPEKKSGVSIEVH